MWSYNYTPNSNEIYHYGVLGMKWGVRRNPSKAYAKAVRKKYKMEKKSAKIGLKSAAKQIAATDRLAKSTSTKGMKKGWKAQAKANKLNLKSAKLRNKGVKWEKKMRKAFANCDIKRIPNGNVKSGKNYVYRKLYGNDSYEVTRSSNERRR